MSVFERLNWFRIICWLILAVILIVTVTPLWVMLKTALMPSSEVFHHSTAWWPTNPTLINFERVLGLLSTEESLKAGGSGAKVNFSLAMLNSVIFTGIIVVMQTMSAAAAAYAFARLRFPGNTLIFGLFVASMMIPGVVTFIPNFILIRDLGWLNTTMGMVAPFCLMQGFSVFFLRQFFLALPKELEEAAYIEGASHFYIFYRIAIPLSITPLITIATLIGINMWNEFLWPYLVAKDESHQVLTVALQGFKSQTPQGQPDWTGLMAATAISVLPTIGLLVVFGRNVVESIQFSGSK
ncbi:MAG: carbohydrate ABC transporter permease [Thiofilum sp.]|uniref:carbohydrate ABC transporter permease n=1 Tax=Thiofilum sp. TaxID=2212733 RepID=UPI0025E5C2EB|nr:carbohydrate ABC transporter permease [Thiofilum sp.]MBK8455522.1 carbohydrate ABC transporter permease [Thiofilum sp.]